MCENKKAEFNKKIILQADMLHTLDAIRDQIKCLYENHLAMAQLLKGEPKKPAEFIKEYFKDF